MNSVVISGKIYGMINHEYDNDLSVTNFTLLNQKYSPHKSTMIKNMIKCRCVGALADYVNTELYEGCNVICTGYLQFKMNPVGKGFMEKCYVVCNTVSILEQEEYT